MQKNNKFLYFFCYFLILKTKNQLKLIFNIDRTRKFAPLLNIKLIFYFWFFAEFICIFAAVCSIIKTRGILWSELFQEKQE